MTSEKLYEKRLKNAVELLGGLALKIYCQIFTGLPDRLVLMPGALIDWVELKGDGCKPTNRQLYVHDQLRKLGFRVWVIDSEETLNDFIYYIKNRK